MTATNTRLTEAARTLVTDPGLWADFRADPSVVSDVFGLDADEVEALKSGDARRLASLGADVDELHTVYEGISWAKGRLRRVARVAPRLAAVVLAAAVWVAPASAGARASGRAGKRIASGRYGARYGVRARYGTRYGLRYGARYGARARYGGRYGVRHGLRADDAASTEIAREAPFVL